MNKVCNFDRENVERENIISHNILVSYFLDEEEYWIPEKAVDTNEKVIECLTRAQLLKNLNCIICCLA